MGPRARVGVTPQQRDAQLLEVLRDRLDGRAGLSIPAIPRQLARERLGGRERVALLLGEQHRQALAAERQTAGEAHVGHHAERVPVAGLGGRAAAGLLGRDVSWRSDHVAAGAAQRLDDRLRDQAEVEHDGAPLRVHEHVRGLEVAVQHARGVDRPDRAGELTQPRSQALVELGRPARARRAARALAQLRGGGQRRAHPLDEVDAVDVLHREEHPLALGEQRVQADEVVVRDVGERAELSLEAVQRARAHAEQGLERDDLTSLVIERLVDDPHPARAEPPADREPPVRAELDELRIIPQRARLVGSPGVALRVTHVGHGTQREVRIL